MEIALIVAGIIATVLSVVGSVQSNQLEQENYEKSIEYNKPVNQVKRLQEAGLNPNLAAGASNTISSTAPSVSNPAESLIGGLGNISQMYASAEGIGLRREQNDFKRSSLEVQQMKLDIQKKLAEQALNKGDLDLAMKALSYDTALATQPAAIEKAFADAGLASNRRSMSDIDLASYDDYRTAIVDNAINKANKTKAETYYLENVKPSIDWHRVNTARMNAEEIARHNSELEKMQKQVNKSNDEYRRRQYNLAVKKYNEAVRQMKWERAHYWLDKAFAIGGGVARTVAPKFGYFIR